MVLENVKAMVIDNVNAPLLLGQSVLERFGSIEIDNVNMEIIFR
jgi:aspartyl protease family protein